MGSMSGTHLLGVFVFFLTLNTLVVGARLYVRLWLKRSAFGWDDVFLLLTYIGLILFVTSALMAMHHGVTNYHLAPRNEGEAARWTAIMSVVCYVISGTVKLSVALVIYRLLDYRPMLKTMMVADITLCLMWTFVSTLILSLGCTGTYISPYAFGPSVCHDTFYAQEASYIFFDTFHVVFPISLLWNVQIKDGQKASVIILFSVGLLSSVAAVLKLAAIIEVFRIPASGPYQDLWQRAVTWSVCEHGLSLFAAAILALRPLCQPLTRGWTSLSGTVSQLYGSSRRDSWMSRPPSSSATTMTTAPARKYSWAAAWEAATMLTNSYKRPSTSTTLGGSATPRAYLTRVSETEHRLMPYRPSDPIGGPGKQWNWTNQWPTEFRAPPASGSATPATAVPPINSPDVEGGSGGAAPTTLLRSMSYDWPRSPNSGDPTSSASNKVVGSASAGGGGGDGGVGSSSTRGSGGNINNQGSSGGGRAMQRNTPDYFTCVVEANERNMTVQEYLRTLGVSSRLTERGSPDSSLDSITSTSNNSGPSGAGGKNWFEGRRLSHMLL